MERRRALTIAAAIALAACTCAHSAQVYRWTDADGKVHFGDRPPAQVEAEEVEIEVRSIEGAPTVSSYSNLPVNIGVSEQVIMYGAEWCHVCKRAKEYMRSRGIAFKEFDIDKSPTGRRHYEQLKGRGVPIILVGNQRMNGFRPARLEALLANLEK